MCLWSCRLYWLPGTAENKQTLVYTSVTSRCSRFIAPQLEASAARWAHHARLAAAAAAAPPPPLPPKGMRPEDDETTHLNALDFYNTETPATELSVAIDMTQLQQQPPSEDLHGPMSSGPMTATSSTAGAGAAASGSMSSALGFGGFGVPDNVATGLFSTMISGAREQAKARGVTGDLNSQIDFLRPYFDVETSEVRQRLLWAMHPRKGARLLAESDLYVPTLLAFTLAALLVAGMKSQELKSVGAEGTLIGTALGAAFSLWGLGSLLLYGVAYLLQLRPRLAQVCGLTGYALCGVCVPLLLGLLPLRLFYPALLLLGGASAASLGGGFATFAESPRHAPRPEA